MNKLSGLLLKLSAAIAAAMAAPTPATAAVEGYVDLHSHLTGEHAFGGSWFWGSAEGPINSALARCDGNFGYGPGMGSHGATVFPILSEFLGGGLSQGDTGWHLGRRRGYDNRRCRYVFGIPIPGTCPRPHFEHWPKWDAIAHQQMWHGHLRSARDRGLRIMGVSLYDSEFLCKTTPPLRRRYQCNEMDSIRRQAAIVRGFVSRNSDWVGIAETPQQARSLIGQGKLALVLTAELTKLFPNGDSRQQLNEFHALGIRSLQVVHHADSRFSGAAPINQLRTAATVAEYLSFGGIQTDINSITCRDRSGNINYHSISPIFGALPYYIFLKPKCDGEEHLNERGLSGEGTTLVNAMMDKGMIIDVSHMSRKAFRQTYDIAVARGSYPLTYSHTHMWDMISGSEDKHEKYLRSEEIEMIVNTGGMIGLRTGPEETHAYVRPPMAQPIVANTCQGSTRSFAQSLMYAIDRGVNVGFGADLNGFIKQTKGLNGFFFFPGNNCNSDFVQLAATGGIKDFHTKGLGHIGHLPELVADLRRVGVPQPYMDHLEKHSAETYLRIWERSIQLAGPGGANLALTAAASASSTYCSSPQSPDHCYNPARVNDGSASSALGGQNSWANDAGVPIPQWIELTWNAPVTVSRVVVTTTAGFEVRDYVLQYWAGGAQSGSWQTLATVAGNTTINRVHQFGAVTTMRLRILGSQGPDAQPGYIRINEFEAYQ